MSVSLRRLLGGVESPTAGNYVYGFTNFQFLGGDLKRVDMNAGRTGSSETVYVELTDLRIHKRDFRLGSIASLWPSVNYFRSSPETDVITASEHVSKCRKRKSWRHKVMSDSNSRYCST